jgi:hypothetical protein
MGSLLVLSGLLDGERCEGKWLISESMSTTLGGVCCSSAVSTMDEVAVAERFLFDGLGTECEIEGAGF